MPRDLGRRVSRRVLQIGLRVSAFGERIGSEWLTYNPVLMWEYHKYALTDAPRVMAAVEDLFPDARCYVDVGAGTGKFAAEVARRGHEVVACERSRLGRIAAAAQGVQAVPFDLEHEPPARVRAPFDLAYCFEVAEHVPERLADRLVAFLTELAPVLVLTAAQPGQGGAGHVNEQPLEYWIQRFERSGHTFDEDMSAEMVRRFEARGVVAQWFIRNLLVFTVREAGAGNVRSHGLSLSE
jgi:SAM-dependent methyltransferase